MTAEDTPGGERSVSSDDQDDQKEQRTRLGRLAHALHDRWPGPTSGAL